MNWGCREICKLRLLEDVGLFFNFLQAIGTALARDTAGIDRGCSKRSGLQLQVWILGKLHLATKNMRAAAASDLGLL